MAENIPLVQLGQAEAVGAALDETGVLLPIGVTIGALGFLRLAHHEIVKFLEDRITNWGHDAQDIPHLVDHHLQPNNLKISLQKLQKFPQVHELVKKLSVALPVAPFSNNIGPGNKPAEPKTQLDADALEHDQAYDTAKSFQDVQKGDINLLKKVGDHVAESIKSFGGNPIDQLHEVIIGPAIGAKYTVEKALGSSIYPQFSGKRRLLGIQWVEDNTDQMTLLWISTEQALSGPLIVVAAQVLLLSNQIAINRRPPVVPRAKCLLRRWCNQILYNPKWDLQEQEPNRQAVEHPAMARWNTL